MKYIKSWNIKLQPVIGIGAYLDQYSKEVHGMDGWAYNIIVPFFRIQIYKIYLPDPAPPLP
jgi:hypothetical protein